MPNFFISMYVEERHSEFSALAKFCDGSHNHDGWGYDHDLGVLNTSKDAEYPKLLCGAYADVLVELAQQQGHSPWRYNRGGGNQAPATTTRKEDTPADSWIIITLVETEPATDDKHCLLQSLGNVPKGAEAKRRKLLCVFGLYHAWVCRAL